jgi:biopolymer transport protein ExbD
MAGGNLPEDDAGASEGGIFAEINITPLTDIFLVLLIIFMVTSSVVVESASRQGIKVNLPKGANQEVDPGAKSLVVSITKANDIVVQGQRVTMEDLKTLFGAAASREAGTQVIIEADQGVMHGTVVGVMELAKQSGLNKLAIATKSGK